MSTRQPLPTRTSARAIRHLLLLASVGEATAIVSAADVSPIVPSPVTELADGGPDPLPAADVDGDGQVGLSDLIAVINSFGVCPDVPECPADTNGDSLVNMTDLVFVLANWT